MNAIKFHLNVCDSQPHVDFGGQRFMAGHRGEITVQHTIKDDTLFMDMDICGHKPYMGDAAHIVAVSIRVCPGRVSTIAIYDDPLLNAQGCCANCDNGCSTYGSSGCGCV